jgi:hypothetical protein
MVTCGGMGYLPRYDMISINTKEGRTRNQLTQGTKCTTDRKKATPTNQTKAATAKAYKNRTKVGRRLALALYGCITWMVAGYGLAEE